MLPIQLRLFDRFLGSQNSHLSHSLLITASPVTCVVGAGLYPLSREMINYSGFQLNEVHTVETKKPGFSEKPGFSPNSVTPNSRLPTR